MSVLVCCIIVVIKSFWQARHVIFYVVTGEKRSLDTISKRHLTRCQTWRRRLVFYCHLIAFFDITTTKSWEIVLVVKFWSTKKTMAFYANFKSRLERQCNNDVCIETTYFCRFICFLSWMAKNGFEWILKSNRSKKQQKRNII